MKFVYPDIQSRIAQVYSEMEKAHGLSMRVCQGLRSVKEQNQLFAQGRTAPGKKVTNAKGGSSFHNFGLAVDSCFLGNDPWLDKNPKSKEIWADYGKLVKQHGLDWGGDFKLNPDRPHAELSYGFSLKEIQNCYRNGGLIAVWAMLDHYRGVEIASEWASLKDELALL